METRSFLGGWKWSRASLRLCFEVFVAVSLSVAYYYQVRGYGIHGDNWSYTMFSACSEKNQEMDNPEVFETWKGRLSGMLLAGTLYDASLKERTFPATFEKQFDTVFGLYHAGWLLLLFLVIIGALRNSLWINLGIFAGLMYNFSPSNGPNFYPWDLPATLFFTLAIILYQRRQLFLMAAVICVGMFFKETVLLCAVLPLLGEPKKWKQRIIPFVAVTVIFLVGKKLLLGGLHLKTAVLSMGDATSMTGLVNFSFLSRNIETLFTPTLNHVLFASAGTLVTILLLSGHKRFLPYTVLIWLFVAGQLMYGTVSEFRIFEEILPLSWILLIGYWKEWELAPMNSEPQPISREPLEEEIPRDLTWARRGTGLGLRAMAVVLVVLISSVVAWRYGVLSEFRSPDHQARVVARLESQAAAGDAQAQFELGKHIFAGEGIAADLKGACDWLRKAAAQRNAAAALALAQILENQKQPLEAVNYYYLVLQLDTNSVVALNNLAWLRATAADPGLRNGDEAVRLALQACQLDHNQEATLIGTLAAAFAETGRFNEAVAASDTACKRSLEERNPFSPEAQIKTVAFNERVSELYKAGQAYHQAAESTP